MQKLYFLVHIVSMGQIYLVLFCMKKRMKGSYCLLQILHFITWSKGTISITKVSYNVGFV